MRKTTKYIVIHCAATKPSMDIGVKEIDRWHRQKGWKKVGYHYVIRRDGTVEKGRGLYEIGAHVRPPDGINSTSVGICMVGGVKERDGKTPENNFTPAQWKSLGKLVDTLMELFPTATITGHRDLAPGRGCPSFSVRDWVRARKENPDSTGGTVDKPEAKLPTLSRGSTGVNVEVLQHALGFETSEVDGIFGKQTELAVIEFQKRNGLDPDGVVGPLTWEHLG